MECFRKILFNNGTTYAGRSSPILHTLLNFFGRKRHSVSSEIVYPIKDSRIWKSGTYPLRLNKGVPSEYLFTLFGFLFNPKSTKSHELFHPFCICSIHFLFGGSQQFPDRFGFSLWREISLVFSPVRAIRVSEGVLEPSANSPHKLVRWRLIRNRRGRLAARRRKSLDRKWLKKSPANFLNQSE